MEISNYLNKKSFKYLVLVLIFLIATSFISLTGGQQEGVSITLSQYPEKLRPGEQIDFSWNIAQRPYSTGEYCFEIIGPDGTVSGYPKKFVIPQREEFDGTDMWKVPSEAPIGKYHATIYFPCTDWRATSTTYFTITRTLLIILKFNDTNQNHIIDDEEKLSDWEFLVTCPDGKTTTNFTDVNGEIRIEVPEGKEGDYTIKEILKSGWENITPTTKTVNVPKDKTTIVPFLNIYHPTGTLLIQKFSDINRNSEIDEDDPKLPDWGFKVTYPNGTITPYITNSTGEIEIKVLPGEYTIEETLKPGWEAITPTTQTEKVAESEPSLIKFLNRPLNGTLLVHMFNDTNHNGDWDAGELPLPNWGFMIKDTNGVIDITRYTTADGSIKVELPANVRYNVTETLPVGWINSTPLMQSVYIKPGEVANVTFGNYIPTPIFIQKFNDINGNGIREVREEGLTGWDFRVTGPGVDKIITTDEKGEAVFKDAVPGQYYRIEELMREDQRKEGWNATTPLIREDVEVQPVPVEFGNSLRVDPCIEYGIYVPPPSEDVSCWHNKSDNLNVTKCLDPCIVHCDNPNPNAGEIINVTLRVCAFPVMAPTDIVLAVDTSGSVVVVGGGLLEVMRDGVIGFIEKNEARFGETVRIGLVNWDDDIDETVNLTTDYDVIKKACGNFSGNLQEFTLYQEGLNESVEVFNRSPRENVKKIIVFITDAKGEYRNITRFPDPEEYTIHSITIGPTQNEEIANMLGNLTSQYGGENVSIIESSDELEKELTNLTVSCIERRTLKNVTVVETLPNYMRALKDGYEIKPTSEHINSDGMEWSTVTMKWDIGDLSSDKCWENTFKVLFCCQVPADVTQPEDVSRITSEVIYSDPTNISITRHLLIPEGGLWIEPPQVPKGLLEKIREVPGFEALFAIAGLLAVAYLVRRRRKA